MLPITPPPPSLLLELAAAEFLASGNWWNHALRVCTLQQHQDNMQIQWSILKYFEPISLHENKKHREEQKTLQDIFWRGGTLYRLLVLSISTCVLTNPSMSKSLLEERIYFSCQLNSDRTTMGRQLCEISHNFHGVLSIAAPVSHPGDVDWGRRVRTTFLRVCARPGPPEINKRTFEFSEAAIRSRMCIVSVKSVDASVYAPATPLAGDWMIPSCIQHACNVAAGASRHRSQARQVERDRKGSGDGKEGALVEEGGKRHSDLVP